MGESLSKPSDSNPSSTPTAAAANSTMTTSNSSGTPQPELDNEPARAPKSSESKPPIHETEEDPAVNSEKVSEDPIDKENEEEGECGFCLYMKAGGCKDTFTDWEKCVDEGEKKKEDIVEKCFQATAALKKCMEAHSDYYAPLLQAEEEAAKQLEQEKDKLKDGGDELGKKETGETLDHSEEKETS
ncbi:hypothetical protein ACS0TY_008921 [Phlomoides rotata]